MTLTLVAAALFLVSGIMLYLSYQTEEGVISMLLAVGLGVVSAVAAIVARKVEPELVQEAARLLYILSAAASIGLSIPAALYLREQLLAPDRQDWALYCAGGIMAVGFLLRLIDVQYLRTAEEVREIDNYIRTRRQEEA
ncbi:MAG: hypothetical protein Q7P63_16280 [Verrucomicrobiota bacterium JB022]|nr:hypothetical protein [Verrucomicrobiota bacterium JB022]